MDLFQITGQQSPDSYQENTPTTTAGDAYFPICHKRLQDHQSFEAPATDPESGGSSVGARRRLLQPAAPQLITTIIMARWKSRRWGVSSRAVSPHGERILPVSYRSATAGRDSNRRRPRAKRTIFYEQVCDFNITSHIDTLETQLRCFFPCLQPSWFSDGLAVNSLLSARL